MKTARFPLDFDKLQRGDNLSPEQVEEAVLLPRSHIHYRIKQLKLKELIEDHFLVRGDVVSVVTRGAGIRILTHAEQAEHAPRRQFDAMRLFRRQHVKLGGVDPAQLPSEEARQRLARAQEVSGWRVQQLLKPAPKELPL